MFVRQLTYLVTLAKERHFTRAAEACHVSQPTLSAAIQHLEEELGVLIVQRGQRFAGFTAEGNRVLIWAQRILADWEGLKQDLTLSMNSLSGTLRLGAIPTTLPIIPLLTTPCLHTYPEVKHRIMSLSAEHIIRQIDEFELDMGLTYLQDQRLQGLKVLPLYEERYVLLARNTDAFNGRDSLQWIEIIDLPLCLLSSNMQNRRIIDAAFRRTGAIPRLCVETDSIFTLYSHVRNAGLYSVVPHSMLCLFELNAEMTAIRLMPELSRSICLIASDREPVSPLLSAVWTIFSTLNLQKRFDDLIGKSY